jgi:hypothetical protein
MSPENDAVARLLHALPTPALPPALRARTLARARGHLAPPPGAVPRPLAVALPAYAASAALISADAVFLADACLKMGRAFGG